MIVGQTTLLREEMTDFRFTDGFKITGLCPSMGGIASRKTGRKIPRIAFTYAVKRTDDCESFTRVIKLLYILPAMTATVKLRVLFLIV